jgi:amidase
MIRISGENCTYSFSKDNKPAAVAQSGEIVIFETLDCFGNQVQSNNDKLESMDWNRVNPATGPVYVKDAEPGDTLKVTIGKINCRSQGVIATVNTGTPGNHGGNMDNTKITENTIMYFPLSVPGALFALGDLHAIMGDGEISGTGLEVAGEVQVQLEVIKGLKLNNPVLENENSYAAIASSSILDEAVSKSVNDMFDIVTNRIGLLDTDVVMLFSLVGKTEICQVVDPLKTARFVIPKWVLNKYNFKFI